MLLFVHQRRARARCEEILAGVPPLAALDHDARGDAAHDQLVQTLRDLRLTPGTTAKGVASLLLRARDTGNAEVWQRVIDRAIPLRGRLRRGPAVAALAVTIAITAGLAWISPWAPAVAIVLVLWLAFRALQRYVARHAGVIEIAHMEEAAQAAARAGDIDTVNALYAEARRLIAEDRVPARVGFRVANILGAAAIATPFPVDILRELRQLWLVAPEAELSYARVRDELERRLQSRIELLAASIDRAFRKGEDAGPLRAELRELARTAPVVTRARVYQAEILQHIARRQLDADPAVPLTELLDEIEELIAWLEGIEGGVPVRDRSPRELTGMLDEIIKRSTDPGTRGRADALRARIDVLPIQPLRKPPALPGYEPAAPAPRRRSRPLPGLRAAVTTSAPGEQARAEVAALYRQVRDAADRGGEHEVKDLITAMRLASTWASKHDEAGLLGAIRNDARELLDRRNVPAGTGAALAGVLRECAHADPFPATLLDDYARLRRLAPDLVAPLFWSIVDAAIHRLEMRIGTLAKTGDSGSLAAITAELEATAADSSDPEITARARKLAASIAKYS